MSDHPNPIEELRRCLSEPRFTTSKAITDALAAYDAKCAEVERLKGEVAELKAFVSKFSSLRAVRPPEKWTHETADKLLSSGVGKDWKSPVEYEELRLACKKDADEMVRHNIAANQAFSAYKNKCDELTTAIETERAKSAAAEAKVEQLKAAFEQGRSRIYSNFAHVPEALRAADWMWITFSKAANPPTNEPTGEVNRES